jgi:hypothetical protein
MSNSASLPERGAYRRSYLLEFLAAEIDGLDGPYVGDVIEGIFLQPLNRSDVIPNEL